MARTSHFIKTPPFEIESAIKKLGGNLRTARIRRNMTAQDLASKLGDDRHVIADAERGKLTTSIAVYAGILWALRLLPHFEPVADPAHDEEGLALSLASEPERARRGGGLSNDF